MVIDFHTHTLLSDGHLLISELVRRAEISGYGVVGITDHVDYSNLERVVRETLEACSRINPLSGIAVIPGMEITHVPPAMISDVIARGRELGAWLVIVHGETPAEPVKPGTNRQAILSGADILAHPGLISDDDVLLAREKGVCLEISGKRGHCLANGHVARKAEKYGAKLLVASDAHTADDIFSEQRWKEVALGAGVDEAGWEKIVENGRALARRLGWRTEENHGADI